MRKIILILPLLFLIACSKDSFPQAERVEITDFPEQILIGESGFLEYKVLPSDASSKSIVFESSDKSIIDVTSNGKITAHKEGKATIRVSTQDGLSFDECEVEAVNIDAFISFYRSSFTSYNNSSYFDVGVRIVNRSDKSIKLKEFKVTDSTGNSINEERLSDTLKLDEDKEFKGRYELSSLPIRFTISYTYNDKEFIVALKQN